MIEVLDKGFVRLVEHMGGDLSVVRNARNSHDAAWRAGLVEGSDHKLINYLMKHHHSTPFEAVTMTFEVKAPIFVFRQWHRHRVWTYNEVSARYSVLADEFYSPTPHTIGSQSKSNKQGRDISIPKHPRYDEVRAYEAACHRAFAQYHELLDADWPRELARMVLPVSTYSKMFATVNLWNLFKFLTLRDDNHAQYEIRVYAQALKELAHDIAPVSVEAWESTREVLG